MFRRFLQKQIQSLNSLLIVTEVYEGLTEDELSRASSSLAFGNRDLRLVACFVIVLLVKIGVGQKIVWNPVFIVSQHGLLQR